MKARQKLILRLALLAATVAFSLTGHHGMAIAFAVITVLSLVE